MQKKWHGVGLALLLLSIAAIAPTPTQAQTQAQEPARPAAEAAKKGAREMAAQNRKRPETRKQTSCTGEIYFNCICPGDSVCPHADGEYDYPAGQCDKPVDVTGINIDNIVGSLKLADPPCTEPKLCRRISVNDSSSAPKNNPDCRCREKVAVCRRIFY